MKVKIIEIQTNIDIISEVKEFKNIMAAKRYASLNQLDPYSILEITDTDDNLLATKKGNRWV